MGDTGNVLFEVNESGSGVNNISAVLRNVSLKVPPYLKVTCLLFSHFKRTNVFALKLR